DQTRFAYFQMASYLSRGVMLLLLGATVLFGVRRRQDPLDASFIAFGGFLALAPTVHPWYATWGVPFLTRARGMGMLCFSALVLLSYHVLATSWKEDVDMTRMEYLPVAFVMAWGLWPL